jgi:hypothetical protein
MLPKAPSAVCHARCLHEPPTEKQKCVLVPRWKDREQESLESQGQS